MPTHLENYDWKKAASAELQTRDAELAFQKAASRKMEDTAGNLFTDDYYIGFEIVKANSDFSKMVGIFVFRVNKNLIYAPVFYIDGKIKGGDIAYLVDQKIFSALTPEWAKFYISDLEVQNGAVLESDADKGAVQAIDMLRLAYPPFVTKTASDKGSSSSFSIGRMFNFTAIGDENDNNEDFTKSAAAFFNEKDDSKYLKSYLEHAGLEAYEGLSNKIKENPKFASYIIKVLDEEDYVPSDEFIAKEKAAIEEKEALKKKASLEEQKPLLAVHFGKFNYKTANAEKQIENGYTIEDNRDEKDLGYIITDEESDYRGVSPSGINVYDILGQSGKSQRFLCVGATSDGDSQVSLLISADDKDPGVILYNSSDKHSEVAGHGDVGARRVNANFKSVLGTDKDISEDDAVKVVDKFIETDGSALEVGKAYTILDLTQHYISDEPWLITSKEKDEDGIVSYEAIPIRDYRSTELRLIHYPEWTTTITVNPDLQKSDIDNRVFSGSASYIRIPIEKRNTAQDAKDELPSGKDKENIVGDADDAKVFVKQPKFIPGRLDDLYQLGATNGFKRASVSKDISGEKFIIKVNDKPIFNKGLNKIGAVVTIMDVMNLDEASAEGIVKEASENNSSVKFLFTKYAKPILLDPEPKWFEGFDSDLLVPYTMPETKVVRTVNYSDGAPNPRYGDKLMQPMNRMVQNQNIDIDKLNAGRGGDKTEETGNTFLRIADPMMLAELAEKSGKKSLFEHGIIATMSQAYDAKNFINDYIPGLKDGLDKLCRLYFLLLWKPATYIDLYGSDDLTDLENNLVTSIKYFGDLVLELLKQTKDNSLDISAEKEN